MVDGEQTLGKDLAKRSELWKDYKFNHTALLLLFDVMCSHGMLYSFISWKLKKKQLVPKKVWGNVYVDYNSRSFPIYHSKRRPQRARTLETVLRT